MRLGLIVGILGRGIKGTPLEETRVWLAAARVPLEMEVGPSLEMGEGLLRGEGADLWRVGWDTMSP